MVIFDQLFAGCKVNGQRNQHAQTQRWRIILEQCAPNTLNRKCCFIVRRINNEYSSV